MSAVKPVPETEVVCAVDAVPKHVVKPERDVGVAATEVVIPESLIETLPDE